MDEADDALEIMNRVILHQCGACGNDWRDESAIKNEAGRIIGYPCCTECYQEPGRGICAIK